MRRKSTISSNIPQMRREENQCLQIKDQINIAYYNQYFLWVLENCEKKKKHILKKERWKNKTWLAFSID